MMRTRRKIFYGAAALSGLALLAGAAFVWLGAPADTPVYAECRALDETDRDVFIKGGTFTMGGDVYEDEGPAREVTVGSFRMDTHEVSNAQFAAFVEDTGYKTVAERGLRREDFPNVPDEFLKPGSLVFIMPADLERGGDVTQWWQFVPGANWRHPEGPGSSIEERGTYPVVHVTYEDAKAYAGWAGRALPTEAEWEYAARGGLEDARFAWKGDALAPEGRHRANTWQGVFPLFDDAADGYHLAAPAGCFPPNGYGLYDMTGNVWEWTGDWYAPRHGPGGRDPQGVAREASRDPRQPGVPVRVIKGGSFLCAPNYCMRYRPGARHAQDLGLGAAHLGFRTIRREGSAKLNTGGS